MDRPYALAITILVCVLGVVGCDNSPPLERAAARERGVIVGEFHTENPENIQFPVKVLFAIDCSLSMLSSDPLNPPDEPYGRRIAAAMPNAELVAMPEAGHLPWLDDPVFAARKAGAFLDGAVGATTADAALPPRAAAA